MTLPPSHPLPPPPESHELHSQPSPDFFLSPRGFLEVMHQLLDYFLCSCSLPRVTWLFLRCSFLGASVVSWLCPGQPVLPRSGSGTAAGSPMLRLHPQTGQQHHPGSWVQRSLLQQHPRFWFWTRTPVTLGRAGAAPGEGSGRLPLPGWAGALHHRCPEVRGGSLGPAKWLLVSVLEKPKQPLEGAGRSSAGRSLVNHTGSRTGAGAI